MNVVVKITPRGPLMVRDGRPFGGAGAAKARSLSWPYPSVTTGAVRTLLGKLAHSGPGDPFADPTLIESLKQVSVGGPLLEANGELYVPAPSDFLLVQPEGGDIGSAPLLQPLRPQPLSRGGGCNLPYDSLWPIAVADTRKPIEPPTFWSAERLAQWLATDSPPDFHVPRGDSLTTGAAAATNRGGFLPSLEKEERVHVMIDPETLTSSDGDLFLTQGLAFPMGFSLGVRIAAEDNRLVAGLELLVRQPIMHPMGGERRLAEFFLERDGSGWRFPASVVAGLRTAWGVRMALVTPGLFKHGWLPGWLKEGAPDAGGRCLYEGSPPGLDRVKLVLRGACIGRWRPVSGWSLEAGRVGPKPVRRLVPAGAVYFFEVKDGTPAELAERLWLQPVSDDPQDRQDGFGLAVWGRWDSPKTGSLGGKN
jgi:CRISPR-associated protein Cmr3